LLDFFDECFVVGDATKQFPFGMKPFRRLGRMARNRRETVTG
jgi:hypothetical protein